MTYKTIFKLATALALLVLILFGAWYLRFGGVTHEAIVDVVNTESAKIQEMMRVDHAELGQKLSRIEGKLDRLLEIANRPAVDGLQSGR